LRIDDLDTTRNVHDADYRILTSLETFGLHWDGEVCYQSQHLDHYNDALNSLFARDLLYPCLCSRKSLSNADGESDVYPGFCRNRSLTSVGPYALRVKTDQRVVSFTDRLQGQLCSMMAKQQGDFVVKRKDQIIAYQFAVVIDDAIQGVNHVVRGIDLLDPTIKQIYLQQLLKLKTPNYMHVPVLIDQHGYKLSKQTLASPVNENKKEKILFDLLVLLQQNPPAGLAGSSVAELLQWATTHWQPKRLKCSRSINPGHYSD
jgi:glutamyl-Q tRNA(Asp) synthetase